MRLLWCMPGCRQKSMYNSLWVRELTKNGFQVIPIDTLALAEVFGPHGMQDLILEYARIYRPDAMLVLQRMGLERALLRQLKALGVVLVGFHAEDGEILSFEPDDPHHGARQMRLISYLDPECELVLTASRMAVEAYPAAGLGAPEYITLPISWEEYPTYDGPVRPIIGYFGTPKPWSGVGDWRTAAIRRLLAEGLPVEVFGPEWHAMPEFAAIAKPLQGTDLWPYVGSAAVNLGLPYCPENDLRSNVRFRLLEIAACGGMQLTDYCPEVDDYYTVGEEVAVYRSMDEMVDQARYYLNHPEEGRKLAAAGHKAIERHSWYRWWDDVAERLAKRGIHLDMASKPVVPTGPECQMLTFAAVAMGHACERVGQTVQAMSYFEEALQYRPNDLAAHSGMARLQAGTPAEIDHWRAAAKSFDFTSRVWPDERLGFNGIGSQGSAFSQTAAHEWMRLANGGSAPDVMDAAIHLAPYEAGRLNYLAGLAAQNGMYDLAVKGIKAYLHLYPDDMQAQTFYQDMTQWLKSQSR